MFTYRPYEPQDVNFIQSSWGSSYYKGGEFHKWLTPDTFHNYHRPIREKILSQPTLAIIVCCSSEDKNQIIGWIAVEPLYMTDKFIVHYVYVKQLYKGEGIAKDLFHRSVPHKPIYFSHMTDKAWKILAKHEGDYFYSPHLI